MCPFGKTGLRQWTSQTGLVARVSSEQTGLVSTTDPPGGYLAEVHVWFPRGQGWLDRTGLIS
jgi:hypothetical protein